MKIRELLLPKSRLNKTDLELKRCYICGKYEADSKDHVPPRNIFLKEDRDEGIDLITVPAHTLCNQSFQKDDEHFRLFLSIPSYWESAKARKLWDDKISKRFHRPEGRGFKRYITKNMYPVELTTPSGIYLGKTQGIKFDSDRVTAEVERIARGIFYKETSNILPRDWKVEVSLMSPKVREMRYKIDNANNWNSFANYTFKYVWNHTKEDVKNGVFWVVFFNTVDFWVFVSDPLLIEAKEK